MSPMPAGGGTKAKARQEAQRERILEAARACFSEGGFHGTGMSAIARAAGMSQGLIYRYFTNKAAIIRAITDEQREERREALAGIATCSELVDRLLEKVDAWRESGPGQTCEGGFDAALFLEVSAEATRDADIAAVVTAQEPQIWVDFEDLVRRSAAAAGKPLEADAVRRRTVVMRCLVDGLILCYVRDPQQDREVLRHSLQEAITALCL
ncbi:MAG TPA: helix-turn-helix domain-containing protein [Arenimonas sp.]|tara:strand:- start:172 stop:801 length:630 start_codon:yes stop_codon:yes gene_type:complete